MGLVCNLDGKKYVFCDSIFNLLVDLWANSNHIK